MMALRLEVFDAPAPAGDMVLPVDPAVEEMRLAAFDNGYRAGWDDALAAQESAERELRDAIARQIQELAFSYHDARGHILQGLRPLINDVVTRLLPQVAQAALPQLVVEALIPFAEIASAAPVEILAHPAASAQVAAALADATALPVRMVEDESLVPTQVCLRLGTTETWVDLSAAHAAIADALLACFPPPAGGAADE